MIDKREIETQLDIHNPIHFYSDEDNNLLNTLKTKYENRCYRSCFILKILNIVRKSEGVVYTEQSSVFVRLSVVFNVECLVYNIGDIINGCRVVNKRSEGVIICQHANAAIFINANKLLESITEGQLISVRVGKIRYDLFSDKISINAYPMIYNFAPKYYYINNDEIGETGISLVRGELDKLKMLEEELNKLQKEQPNAYKFFNNLFYAYTKEIEGVKSISVHDNFVGWVCRDPKLNLISSNLAFYENVPIGVNIEVMSSRASLLTCINDCSNYINMMIDYIKIYNDEKITMEHKNYWMVWTKSKKSIDNGNDEKSNNVKGKSNKK